MSAQSKGFTNQESLVSVWDEFEEPSSPVKASSYDDDVKDNLPKTEEEYAKGSKLFCLTLSSNTWFLIGSIFYVWLAAIDLQWEKAIVDIPEWVLVADDDYSWEGYEYGGDDYVFQAGNSWVSQAQIVYAIAALSFVITGFIDLFAYPGLLGIFFILAGAFGLVSAFLLEEDEHLSNVFNLVSVHLFLLEAVGLLTRRSFFGGLKFWVRVADLFFALGAVLDVALSYVNLFNKSNISLARLEVSSQVFWLVCSLIYIGATFYGKQHGYFETEIDVVNATDPKKNDVAGALDSGENEGEKEQWVEQRPADSNTYTGSSLSEDEDLP